MAEDQKKQQAVSVKRSLLWMAECCRRVKPLSPVDWMAEDSGTGAAVSGGTGNHGFQRLAETGCQNAGVPGKRKSNLCPWSDAGDFQRPMTEGSLVLDTCIWLSSALTVVGENNRKKGVQMKNHHV